MQCKMYSNPKRNLDSDIKDLPYNLKEEKAIISKLSDKYGVAFIHSVQDYARFNCENFEDGTISSLFDWDLAIGDAIYVDALLKSTCCTPYTVLRAWRKPFRKPHYNKNKNPSPTISSTSSNSSNYIIKFGSVEVLKDAYGFITFDNHSDFVFFSIDDIQDISQSSHLQLDRLLFEGQFVKFIAIPNPKVFGRAKWKATAVWMKIPEKRDNLYDLTLCESSDFKCISDVLIGTIDSLHKTYGYIAYGSSKDNFAQFKMSAIQDEYNFNMLEDILTRGQTVKFSLLSADDSNAVSFAPAVWIYDLNIDDDNTASDSSNVQSCKNNILESYQLPESEPLKSLPQNDFNMSSCGNTVRRTKSQIALNDTPVSDDHSSTSDEQTLQESIGTIDFLGVRYGYITADKLGKDLIYFHISSVVDISGPNFSFIEDFMHVGQLVLFTAVPNSNRKSKAKWRAKYVWTEITKEKLPPSTSSSVKSVSIDQSSKSCSTENVSTRTLEKDSSFPENVTPAVEENVYEEHIGTIIELNSKNGSIAFGEANDRVAYFHVDAIQDMIELTCLKGYFYIGQKVIFSIISNQKTGPDKKFFATSVWTECEDAPKSNDSALKDKAPVNNGFIDVTSNVSSLQNRDSANSSLTIDTQDGNSTNMNKRKSYVEDIGIVSCLNCTYGYLKFKNSGKEETVFFHRNVVQDANQCHEFLEDFMTQGQKVLFNAVPNCKPHISALWFAKCVLTEIDNEMPRIGNWHENKAKKCQPSSEIKICKRIEDIGTILSLSYTYGYISFGKSNIDSVYFHMKSLCEVDNISSVKEVLHEGQSVKFIAVQNENFSEPYWYAETVWFKDTTVYSSEGSTTSTEKLESEEFLEMERSSIEEFGNIEFLSSVFGYIQFKDSKENYQQAFFHRKKVADIKYSEVVLEDIMYVGQRVYFSAIPNVKKSKYHKAQWYCTSVWFKNSSIAQKISTRSDLQSAASVVIAALDDQEHYQPKSSKLNSSIDKNSALCSDLIKRPENTESSGDESSISTSEYIKHNSIDVVSSSEESHNPENVPNLISSDKMENIRTLDKKLDTSACIRKNSPNESDHSRSPNDSDKDFDDNSDSASINNVKYTQSLEFNTLSSEQSVNTVCESSSKSPVEFCAQDSQNINATFNDPKSENLHEISEDVEVNVKTTVSSKWKSSTSIETVIENNPCESSENILNQYPSEEIKSEAHSDTDIVSKISKSYSQANPHTMINSRENKQKKTGIIYSLAPTFGHINFGPSKCNLAFFFLNCVRDAKASSLKDILTVGQTVRFLAVPNKRLNSVADWFATDVWIKEISELSLRETVNNRLSSSAEEISHEYFDDINSHKISPLTNPIITKDYLVSSGDIKRHSDVLGIEEKCNENSVQKDQIFAPEQTFLEKNSGSDIPYESNELIFQNSESIREGRGNLLHTCDNEAMIHFTDAEDIKIQVLDNSVYENGNKVSNLLNIQDGQEVNFDAVKIQPNDIWIASAVWIGSRPDGVGLSTTNFTDEVERLSKIYSKRNDHLLNELIKELQDFVL